MCVCVLDKKIVLKIHLLNKNISVPLQKLRHEWLKAQRQI